MSGNITRRSRKTYKKTTCSKQQNAIAVLDMSPIKGIVKFTEIANNRVLVSYDISGLKDGKHGFHIHQYGDLSDGCTSACAHFNPDNTEHGGPYSEVRHAGDLGNVEAKNGYAKGQVTVNGISTDPRSKRSIIGRAIIVHADPDDLGRGGDEESKKTGNAGKRIACAVIGFTSI